MPTGTEQCTTFDAPCAHGGYASKKLQYAYMFRDYVVFTHPRTVSKFSDTYDETPVASVVQYQYGNCPSLLPQQYSMRSRHESIATLCACSTAFEPSESPSLFQVRPEKLAHLFFGTDVVATWSRETFFARVFELMDIPHFL